MEETKDNKRIITNEEFLQYKKQIESRDTDLEQFIFIIFRERYGLSWLEIERLFGVDFDEDNIEKETEEEFLSKLSENKKEIFKQISKKIKKELPKEIDISNLNNDKSLAHAVEVLHEFDEKLEEVYENEENEICEILSNSDLSQVEPESFFDCDFLEKINLEWSGAKLDMKKFSLYSKIKGSIKGCELISYNSARYKRHIKPEFLDKSQYITVIEDILLGKGNIDYRGEEDFLFESQEIQDQIQWIYDKFLKNDKNAWACQKVFDLMTSETKARNKEYVKKILEYSISQKQQYSFECILEYCDKELFDDHFDDIVQLYYDNQRKNVGGLIDLWSKCSSEIQIDKYEEFKKIISENDRESLFSCSNFYSWHIAIKNSKNGDDKNTYIRVITLFNKKYKCK